MSPGCLPLFWRATRTAKEEDEDSFDHGEEIEEPSRSLPVLSPGFSSAISRKDSGFTLASNSTVSSMRSVSVTFNPTVDEVVFDKNEAPCAVRRSYSECVKPPRITRANTSHGSLEESSGLGNKTTTKQHQMMSPPPVKLVYHHHHQTTSFSSMKYHHPPPSISIPLTRSRSDSSHTSAGHRTERRHLVSHVH